MDGTPAAGSAAASSSAPAAEAAAPPGEQSTLAGVLERADALAVASLADAEPLYRRIIDGKSDLVVTPADDVNAIKQAAIIGALPRAGVCERGLLGIFPTMRVLCKLCSWQWCHFLWCATGRRVHFELGSRTPLFFSLCFSPSLCCLCGPICIG